MCLCLTRWAKFSFLSCFIILSFLKWWWIYAETHNLEEYLVQIRRHIAARKKIRSYLISISFSCLLIYYNYSLQVSVLADDILKNVEYDALRIVFNKFQSVVSFLSTTATILSPEVMWLPLFINMYTILVACALVYA